MTERSRPWDGTTLGDATESPYDAATEFARILRATTGSEENLNKGGVVMDATGFADYAISTFSANVSRVQSGLGWVQGTWHESDNVIDFNIPTPSASTRVDRIVLRKSWASQTVRLTRIAGTEGAGPPGIASSFGSVWDVPLWLISITTGTVITYTDERRSVGAGHAQLLTPTVTGVMTLVNGAYVSGGTIAFGMNPPPASIGVYLSSGMLLTGSTQQQGVNVQFTANSAATSTVDGVYSAPATQAASFTVGTLSDFHAGNPTKGAGSTITTAQGMMIDAITVGGVNNYGLVVNTPSGGSADNISIVALGPVRFSGLAAFAASDHYVVVDSNGNLHKSAIGPAS